MSVVFVPGVGLLDRQEIDEAMVRYSLVGGSSQVSVKSRFRRSIAVLHRLAKAVDGELRGM